MAIVSFQVCWTGKAEDQKDIYWLDDSGRFYGWNVHSGVMLLVKEEKFTNKPFTWCGPERK